MTSVPATFSADEPASTITELIEFLEGGDLKSYSFRGQPQDYGGLFPSRYRRHVLKGRVVSPRFRELSRGLYSEATRRDLQRDSVRRDWASMWGHSVANILAQQYGLSSETVDITDDVRAAAFFATRRYPDYSPIEAAAKPGVIYRFSRTELEPPSLTLDLLQKRDTLLQVLADPGGFGVEVADRHSSYASPEAGRAAEGEPCNLIAAGTFVSGETTGRLVATIEDQARAEFEQGRYSPGRTLVGWRTSRWSRQAGGFILPAVAYLGRYVGGVDFVRDPAGPLVLLNIAGDGPATGVIERPVGIVDLAEMDHTERFYFRHSHVLVDRSREELWPSVRTDRIFHTVAKVLAIRHVDYLAACGATSVWDREVGLLDRGFYDTPDSKMALQDRDDMAWLLQSPS